MITRSKALNNSAITPKLTTNKTAVASFQMITRSQAKLAASKNVLCQKNEIKTQKLESRQPNHFPCKNLQKKSFLTTPKAMLDISMTDVEIRAIKTCANSAAQSPVRYQSNKRNRPQRQLSKSISEFQTPISSRKKIQHTQNKNNFLFQTPKSSEKKLESLKPQTPATLPSTPAIKKNTGLQLVGVFRFTRAQVAQKNTQVIQESSRERSVSGQKRNRGEIKCLNVDKFEVEDFESGTKRRHISVPCLPKTDITLKHRRSGQRSRDFRMYNQAVPDLNEIGCKRKRFEDECDYSSDEENVRKAKNQLNDELYQAVKFYVKEQPLDLVGNLKFL